MKLFRSAEEKQQTAAAEAAFTNVIDALSASDPELTHKLVAELGGDDKFAALGQRERRKLGEQAFLQYANNALADDHLSEDEEDALTSTRGSRSRS